ncbi:HAD-IA family hydrolase [Motiliproteus sediminis]|uniref:HAD-IA family hydrolase n=1 Tax=Motiliproteus sediminis TaxID=1468178 RepID=UPI001FE9B209|nr:HAD-IA family hydrolase [Motiliproteus sediminis]
MGRLVIFDWDGTLIDSAARIIECMQRAAEAEAMPALEAEAVRNIIGLGLPEALQVLYPGIKERDVERMRLRYSSFFLAEDQLPSPLFPGVETGLRRLAEHGFRLAVATGKSRRGLDRAFQETGLGELFSDSRCADETRSKPDPHMLKELVDVFAVDPVDAVMVGDTEYDLEMAANAGMPSVGVSYGAHSVDRLQRHKPVMVVDRFEQLEAWLRASDNGVWASQGEMM